MGHPEHQPTFSGIDPDKLPGTINSLERDKNRLQESAARFRTRFTRYGLDTRPLDRLIAISRWADGELPCSAAGSASRWPSANTAPSAR